MTIALITGGFGFVGSHLRPLLSGRGWDVVVSGRKSREAGPGERSVAVELGHVEAVEDLIADCRPDVIFHLAASTLATADLKPSYPIPCSQRMRSAGPFADPAAGRGSS